MSPLDGPIDRLSPRKFESPRIAISIPPGREESRRLPALVNSARNKKNECSAIYARQTFVRFSPTYKDIQSGTGE
jgi:hypothetical protein